MVYQISLKGVCLVFDVSSLFHRPRSNRVDVLSKYYSKDLLDYISGTGFNLFLISR